MRQSKTTRPQLKMEKLMTRSDFLEFVEEEFNIKPDKPFEDDFDTMVLRHKDNKKWFGIVMKISKNKLVGEDKRKVDVLNIKCLPLLRQSLLKNKGIYVAYHMNKIHWISVILEEITLQELRPLVEMSFDLTKIKTKNKR